MEVRRGLGTLGLALVLTVAACSAFGGEPDVDLRGTWVLISGRTADGRLVVTPDTHVTLTFDDDGLGGTAPCNDYGADFDLDGSSFDVLGPGIEQTLMGCGEEQEALESSYLSALADVDTVTRDGDTLTMTGEDIELELSLDAPWRRADIVQHRWRLVTWTDEAGVDHRPAWEPGLQPFLRLGDSDGVGGRISASSGCRVLEGRWRLWRGDPRVTRSEWRGDCPDRLMDQEVAVGNVLSEPVIALRERDGRPELVVRYAHGAGRLVYRR
ncbi:conserved exported hypothetical protein [metagenome]|uniref:DUF306 domain-containing protein n=1 Tax=metagenome TaxID=256318 RepID=A0A2P2CIU1_9ZZZZ